MRKHKRAWTWAVLFVIGFLFWWTVGTLISAAFARESRPVDQKTFSAVMNRMYPDGRGPSSTSRGRGFYRNLKGEWKVRR